ncbi:MAG: 5'-3' exonuclease H3TH domain-containing protein [Arachnia sp.]
MSTLLAFDTSYLYFRAFFGVPATFRAPDGTPVNAVRGTLDAIAALAEAYHPTVVAAAWDDDWRPAWRTALVPSYKAHRVVAEGAEGPDAEESPDDLAAQVPIIREALEALGIAVIGAPEHEADDVLASLAAHHEGSSLIATGDRDLFQLVDADTSVVYLGRGVAKRQLVTPAWLEATYHIPQDRYVDFSVLRGDPSDGLPGVKGIGEKSASSLVSRYPSLAALGAAAVAGDPGLTPRMRSSLAAASDYLVAAEQVVRTVASLEISEPSRVPIAVDEARLAEFAKRYSLASSVRRVRAALGA